MKKTKRNTKLALNSNTIRTLQSQELMLANGGYSRAQPGCQTLDAECANTQSCNTCPFPSDRVTNCNICTSL